MSSPWFCLLPQLAHFVNARGDLRAEQPHLCVIQTKPNKAENNACFPNDEGREDIVL